MWRIVSAVALTAAVGAEDGERHDRDGVRHRDRCRGNWWGVVRARHGRVGPAGLGPGARDPIQGSGAGRVALSLGGRGDAPAGDLRPSVRRGRSRAAEAARGEQRGGPGGAVPREQPVSHLLPPRCADDAARRRGRCGSGGRDGRPSDGRAAGISPLSCVHQGRRGARDHGAARSWRGWAYLSGAQGDRSRGARASCVAPARGGSC